LKLKTFEFQLTAGVLILLSFIFHKMAGPRGSKYYDIFLRQQLQLVTKEDDIVLNEEGFTLLTEIKKEQSIVAASRNMGISYRKAWGLLREIEYVLGFQLVGKHRGGKAGGKTDLTAEGLELTEAYSDLKIDLESDVHDTVKTFFNRINKISER
jgi:molybdate transport system regulatory protein